MIVESQAPARVDLAGGTLDIWPLYLFHKNSQTINLAIQCYARCRLTPHQGKSIRIVSRDLKRRESFPSLAALIEAGRWKLPLASRLVMAFTPMSGFALETDSDVPAGSGLGGSSALNIAICGVLAKFTQAKLKPREMIEVARNVEAQVLGVPTGEQDYYSAMFGGMQAIHLTPRGIRPEKLHVAAADIDSRVALCYTGESRNSGINNWEVEKAHIDENRKVVRHFGRIAAISSHMRDALANRDWQAAGRLLNQEWQERKRSHPGITTRTIDRLMRIALRHGALAGKVCGAGGGGCVVFLVKRGAKPAVEAAIADAGAEILSSRIAGRGLQVRQTQ
jgi:D-glycero-alpha-D-manno-heptose-7-phosphate kinase